MITEASETPATLLVADALFRNGATRVVLSLVERWGGGSSLAVLSRPDGASLVPAPPEVRVVHLVRPGRRLRVAALPALLRLTRLARHHEVVLATSEIGPGVVLAWAAARLAGRPFVVSVHADLDDALREWTPPALRSLVRSVHRRADAAVCVDAGVLAPVLRNGLPADRAHVVRNGIDLGAVRAAAGVGSDGSAAASGRGDDGVPVVVATGRLAHQKGYDVLLRAHADVVARRPHRLRVLNDGADRADLEHLARELGVTGSVEFAGAVPHPLPEVARAALFCLPSRHEGLPLALVEAAALGVPVIASDSSAGVRQVLDDGRTGVLVPVDDVPALAAALEAHLTDPEPLRERARAGLEHVEAFDAAVMAAGWSRVLRTVARTGGEVRPPRPGLRRPLAGSPGAPTRSRS